MPLYQESQMSESQRGVPEPATLATIVAGASAIAVGAGRKRRMYD